MELIPTDKLEDATHVVFEWGEQFGVTLGKMYDIRTKVTYTAYDSEPIPIHNKYIIDDKGRENDGVLICCTSTLFKQQ